MQPVAFLSHQPSSWVREMVRKWSFPFSSFQGLVLPSLAPLLCTHARVLPKVCGKMKEQPILLPNILKSSYVYFFIILIFFVNELFFKKLMLISFILAQNRHCTSEDERWQETIQTHVVRKQQEMGHGGSLLPVLIFQYKNILPCLTTCSLKNICMPQRLCKGLFWCPHAFPLSASCGNGL